MTHTQASLTELNNFTLFTKMGFKATKCSIRLYGIAPKVVSPEFHTIAWSFTQEQPVAATTTACIKKLHWDWYFSDGEFTSCPNKMAEDLAFLRYFGTPINIMSETLCKPVFTKNAGLATAYSQKRPPLHHPPQSLQHPGQLHYRFQPTSQSRV